jgi:phenylpyruvate tautomerase PptA (4-oxalocrotonate tautomerase family)
MPIIELTLAEGTLGDEDRTRLMEQLAATVSKWEGMADDPRVAATVWTFVDERRIGSMVAGGRPPEEPRYRVQITVAEGSLDDERKSHVVAEVTRQVLEAEGSPNEVAQAARVCCHIHEIPDGNWGAAGRVWRLADIVEFAGIDPATVSGLTPDR